MAVKLERRAPYLAAMAARLEVPWPVEDRFGQYRNRPAFCREVLGARGAPPASLSVRGARGPGRAPVRRRSRWARRREVGERRVGGHMVAVYPPDEPGGRAGAGVRAVPFSEMWKCERRSQEPPR
jgi:hypothetical protein